MNLARKLSAAARVACMGLLASVAGLVSVAGAEPVPGASQAAASTPSGKNVRFNRDIRPILSDTCFACHGPDENKRDSPLRLDTREGAFADLGGYFALVPGNPDESELVSRITSDDESMRMPPPDSGKSLSPRQVELLRQWVAEGAEWEDHWSYTPIERPELPAVNHGAWVANPIDRFILARLEELALEPSPEADPVTLVRRLHFDVTGLPPAPEAAAAFAGDPSPGAYAAMVDSLLASPHYGERMAVYWLDLVRYADTTGIHGDNHRDVAPYRDYVIQAFNENMPFDRFTVEQLAGDLLPESTLQQKVASGYNRLNMTTAEGGAQPKEYIVKYAADRVRTASTVWLGATLGCAECHDHKFDPFTTRDFYSFASFFADVEEQPVALPGPPFPVPSPEQAAELARLDAAVAEVRTTLDTQTPELASAQDEWEAKAIKALEQGPQLDAWHALGPFAAASLEEAFQKDFGPESELDLARQYDPGALAWSERPEWADGEVHALAGDNSATYLYRTVRAEQAGPLTLSLGSDDSLKVWLNGKEVLARQIARPVAPDQEKLTLDLEPGENKLLLKVANGGGAYAFYFKVLASGVPENVAAILRTAVEARSDTQRGELAAYYRGISPLLDPARSRLAELEAQRKAIDAQVPRTLVSMSVEPRVVRILPRGNWLDETGEVVTPAIPAFLGSLDTPDRRATRLDLAHWLVERDNPLVVRVFVNRLWRLAFGRGIAMPLDDLGAQASWPTHLELLDWLAAEFIESGWDVKHLWRLMLTSSTYRQSSRPTPVLRERDPNNLWLARQARYRLDAEMVRDNALAISGLLIPAVGGTSVKPYQPAGYWSHLNFPIREYEADQGAALYRRGVYTYWCRTFLHPSLLAFDAPSREECTAQRNRSNTPLQALVLLNDPTYVEAARVFAERIVRAGGASLDERLRFAMRQALSREANPTELELLASLHARHLAEYQADVEAARQLISTGQWRVPQDLDPAELAAWTSVARVILNLHETYTRN